MPTERFSLDTIGIVHSCFKEKFGIPRQPGLAPAAQARLELLPPFNRPEAVEGLSGSSHVWLHFIFHQSLTQTWKPTVRPPRLGGNKRMGVFATRSPVRPNGLGLSVVKLERVEASGTSVILHLSGVDLVDGTPVVDIKPYVPYVDMVAEATNQFADAVPPFIEVLVPEALAVFCEDYQRACGVDLQALLTQVLRQDPRPQYQQPDPDRVYGMRLLEFNVRWRYLVEGSGWKIQLEEIAEL